MHPARSFLLSLEQIGIKLGLDQIRGLLTSLERPDLAFRSVIVAGTNGKGSVAAMVERGLRAAGYRTGRYTSPHLVDIEERFAVDGVSIDSAAFDLAAQRVQQAASRLPAPPSFFEATTALGLDAFREASIDVAVLEVGLGGRLDATNAVDACASAITMIDFDHEEYLGRTLEAIAREKAGVIKPDSVVVLGENPRDVEDVVAETCAKVGATLIRAWCDVAADVRLVHGRTLVTLRTPARTYPSLTLALRGRHQVQNAVTAVRLLEALDESGLFAVRPDAIQAAVEQVEWPARLELRTLGGRDVLIDGAHNPAGARALAAFLAEAYGRRLPLVVGAMRDKNLEGLARALAPAAAHIICTAAGSPRAAAPETLAAVFRLAAPERPVTIEHDPLAALRQAVAVDTPAVVAGSLYLAGKIRAHLS